MTKSELLREIGIHLKKVVDIYNQLAKNPQAFTPGEIDMMVNNATKIIEFASAVKHQPASVTNSDDQVKLRDMEDKLRVLSEKLKSNEFEMEKLRETNKDLLAQVEENKHLADAFKVDVPEVNKNEDDNSTIAKNDLLSDSFKVDDVSELKKDIVIDPTNTKEEPKTITTLNDKKSESPMETLADKLAQSKVEDLKKVIPLHEKFLYTNELFAKDGDKYSSFLDQMNTKTTWSEAESLLAQAASQYKWNPEDKTALQFISLIQRRFA